MLVTLRINPANQTRRDRVAWLLPGSDPQLWLRELKGWNASLGSLVLRPIPRAAGDRTPLGILVSLEDLTKAVPDLRAMGTLAVPYGCLSGRLFLPTDADLWPCVSDAELAGLLPSEPCELVWHPSVGLVRCDPDERLRVFDLLKPPARKASRWDRAVPGLSFRSRLLSIEPTEQLSVEEILRSAGQDIGSQSTSIEDLPPAPGEGLGGQIHQWTKPLRDAWKSLWPKPQPPQSKPSDANGSSSGTESSQARGGSGWLRWLGMAAAPLVAPLVAAGAMLGKMIPQSLVDQAARLREIDRLMHLLKSDPDSGLRFALPMVGEANNRGIAPPSNQLVSRDMNFGLGKLAGGQAADPWDIPPEQQFQLIQMYRELAAREVRMGRHRRAAYIFAELLGDLQAAAGALEAGLHYREAAVLYRDRLKRPHDAARCLERGALLDEAAELYVELGMLEKAADLYTRLERPDEAERLLRNWAGQLEHQGNYLRASEVLHDKLSDIDEALAVLDRGVKLPTNDLEMYFKQIFSLLGAHSRHDAARERVSSLREMTFQPWRATAVAHTLSHIAKTYVDQSVQRQAADATRVVVARQLPHLPMPETDALLAAVRTLAPQDRLLGRDCDRFVRQKEAASRRSSPSGHVA